MPACCSTFERAAEQQFNARKAAEELAQFRKHGPGRTTRLLQEGVADAGLSRGLLLDIGSGIGALTLGLLERGMAQAIAVDASSAYTDAARQEAQRRGRADAIQFVHADFVSMASRLPTADVVTLDRVVCCYPACAPLLDAALRHTGHCFALSYPRDVWYVRLGVLLENVQRRLARNPFRTLVHPVHEMKRLIEGAGFELRSRRETWMWSADTYVRPTESRQVASSEHSRACVSRSPNPNRDVVARTIPPGDVTSVMRPDTA
jgi:SAM-dependent methyltransferase